MPDNNDPQNNVYDSYDKSLYKLELPGSITNVPQTPSSSQMPSATSDDLSQAENPLNQDLSVVGGHVIPVALSGNIQAAIDTLVAAGGGQVNLLAGTYHLTSDLVVSDGVSLVGSSVGTIIDFGGKAACIRINGSNSYNPGTLSITYGTTSVVGVGTTWTSSMVGRYILLQDFWYPILTVNSTTSITLGSTYVGDTLAASTYYIATTVSSMFLSGFTVQNSSIQGIDVQFMDGGTFDGVTINSCLYALLGANSSNITFINGSGIACTNGFKFTNFQIGTFTNNLVDDITGGAGIYMDTCRNWAINNLSIQGITGNGMTLTGCSNLGIENFSIKQLSAIGVEFVANNFDISYVNGLVATASSDGIKLTATSNRNTFSEIAFDSNGGYGINIAASSDVGNILVANTYNLNTSGTYQDLGTSTVIYSTTPSKYGGTGSDGALSITSGVTTISLGNATSFVKNYTSISITGTGQLAFSNPNTNGTVIILKSQGAVTLTSSGTPLIEGSSMGASSGKYGNSIGITNTNPGLANTGANNSSTGGVGGAPVFLSGNYIKGKSIVLACGSGGIAGGAGTDGAHAASGGGGGGASIITSGGNATNGAGSGGTSSAGTGGIGGGAIYIECGGALNATGTIYVKGADGGAATGQGGGGGGGGGGMLLILYATLTANSLTVTTTGGGSGSGAGSGGNGGTGGIGFSLVTSNTEF